MQEWIDNLVSVLPSGGPVVVVLIGVMALGVYAFATGLAGVIWPVPEPQLSEYERVKEEVATERKMYRDELRARNPVYKTQLMERFVRPMVEQLGGLLTDLLKKLGVGQSAYREVERKLDLLGNGETVSGFWGQRIASGVVLTLVVLTLGLTGIIEVSAVLLIVTFAAGMYLPILTLNSKVKKMRDETLTQLPSFIDLLAINVQSGVGLEQAVERVAVKGGGSLPKAIRRAFAEARYRQTLAQSRARSKSAAADLLGLGNNDSFFVSNKKPTTTNVTLQALGDMATRFRLPELDDFVSALETSDRQGIPVVETLTNLAGVMREKKRARLIAAGNKSVAKMMFPVAVFILPAFLLLLLTPAILQFLQLAG